MIFNDVHQMNINKNISNLLKFPINNVNFNDNNNNNISKKNNIIISSNNKYINNLNMPKSKIYNNSELDDSLSQISLVLNKDKKNLNYTSLFGKIPGIAEKPNFVYDQILFNKKKYQ
jgi:hypothetical protein